jgi:hypothetical protein
MRRDEKGYDDWARLVDDERWVGKVSSRISARRKLILTHLILRNIMAILDLYRQLRSPHRDVSIPYEI